MLKPANKYFDYLVIALVVVIAYWQVSLFQYTIKSDAALLSLPWKKFVSDSLRSGYFPIWNPYINMGWTQGMELSTWYYPSWIFSLFGKFRLSFLEAEIALHLILGAIGMYKFLSLLHLNRWALIHGSLLYILSGFFVGNFQHLGWTFYACWLPILLYCLIQLIKTPNLSTSIKFGFSAAMLALCSYIPFTVTTLIFILLFITAIYINRMVRRRSNELIKLSIYLFLSIIIIVIICSPAIYTLMVNIDTMYRSGKYTDQAAAFGSLVPMAWLNLFFPFGSIATSSYWKGTDVSMINLFIGWISFLFIGFAFLEKEKRKVVFFVASLGLLALLFSFGKYSPPTWFVFRHLPFYEKLRFAAQFRLYFIFAAAVIVAIGTQYLLKNYSIKKTQWFLIVCGIILLAIGAYNNHDQFLNNFNVVMVQEKNKYTLWQTIKFQSIIWGILSIILVCVNFIRRKQPTKVVQQVIIANIVILSLAVQMNMFYTGVANKRVPSIDKQFLQLPEKFTPVPNKIFNQYGMPGIGLTWTNTGGLIHVPTVNCYHPYDSKNYGEYMQKNSNFGISSPMVYTKDSLVDTLVSSILLTPYKIEFTTNNHLADSLFIALSKTPSTKVWVNEKSYEPEVVNSELLLKSIEPNSKVTISFVPTYAIDFSMLGLVSFIVVILIKAFQMLGTFVKAPLNKTISKDLQIK